MLKRIQRATLKSQGLAKPSPFGRGKKGVLAAIEHLGYIQIDTLSVVERAHHHTLWTRVPDYKSGYLEKLVKERKVFEYWFHAASYLPFRDFRYALPLMQYFKSGESRYFKNVDPKVESYVYETIRDDGPQKARDFQTPKKKPGSWWNWKPAKSALEKLFMQGDLMITGRNGMEKVYDTTERVLPGDIDTSDPTPEEYAQHLVNTHLQAYGITNHKQITHLRMGKGIRENVRTILESMVENKSIEPIHMKGAPVMYSASGSLDKPIKKPIPSVRLLSPFDNSVIHRERLAHLFNFDFQLECYVPQPKRQFGYFCLPILFGDQFIGRVDCKAHRKNEVFELIHLHIEKGDLDIDEWFDPFMNTVKRFADYNQCQLLKLTRVSANTSTTEQEISKRWDRSL